MSSGQQTSTRNCPSAETVWQFLADQLDEATDSQFGSHLEDCLACQQAVERHMASIRPKFEDDGDDVPRALKEAVYELSPAGPLDRFADTAPNALEGRLAEDPRRVGRFVIERRLGVGGFGVVLLAHDPILNRHVALKLPRLPHIIDPAQQARFYREAQSAAGLHHPNIVPVYDAGHADGLHYLTTDYCPGPNLAHWFAEQSGPLPPKIAARIVLALAQAVEHAHQNGILHRDIKPGNVLLDPRSHNRPHAPAEATRQADQNDELPFTPKLTDFGLAKFLNHEANVSNSGSLAGTPRYMAPEQAAGRRESIGPASDVYALGVVLYELLTKRPPIAGQDNADTLRRVLVEEPLPPRRIVSQIPRDLEAICLKSLEKAPQRRYTSAAALAADLTRFLGGESTQARPFRLHERLVRTARRAPAITALVATVVTAVALLIAGLAMHLAQVTKLNVTLSGTNIKLDEALQSATREKERASNLLYASDITNAYDALQSGDVRQASTLLGRHVPQPGQPDRRGFEWHYLHRKLNQEPVSVAAHASDIYCVGYSPDGNRIVTCGKDGFVRVWDASTLAKVQELNAQQGEVNSATFSPDGRCLATTGDDGSITIWDWQAGRAVQRVDAAHGGGKTFHAFYLGDGKLLASCGENNGVHFWDAETLSRLPNILSGSIDSVALSADGRWLATAGAKPDWKVGVWDLAGFAASDQANDQRSIELLGTHPYTISGVAFSPNGQLLATCDRQGRAKVWDLKQRLLRRELRCLDSLHAVEFSPDGGSLAAASRGGSIHTWSIEPNDSAPADRSGEFSWKAHAGRVWSLDYSPDGWHLASGGADGMLKLWPHASPLTPSDVSAEHTHDFVCIPGTSQFLHSGLQSAHHCLTVYDLDAGTRDLLTQEQLSLLAASADGSTWASTDWHRTRCSIWKASERQQIASWSWDADPQVDRIQLSPHGEMLAAITDAEQTRVRLFEVQSGKQIAACDAHNCRALAFSPAGGLLAYNQDTSILLASASNLEQVAELRGHGADYVSFVVFSPDGRWLASAGKDRLVKVWDVATRREIHSLDGQAVVTVLAFSPNGKTLASGARGERVSLWHVATGQKLFELDTVSDFGGPLEFLDNARLAYRRSDWGLSVLSVAPQADGDRSKAGRGSLSNGWTHWTWNAIPKPSNRVLFARAGASKVHVDKESAACEQLKISQGEVDFWLEGDCLVHSDSPEPPSPSIDIGQANSTGAGATLRLHGPGRLVSKGLASIGEQRQSAGTVIVGAAPAEGPGSAVWDLDGELYLGKLGAGMLRIEGGGRVSVENAYLGGVWGTVGGSGTATVTGSGTQWIHTADLQVGYWGIGTLNVTQGGIVSGASGFVGYRGQGTVTISGAGSQWRNTRDVTLGNHGQATMKIEAGGLFSCRDGLIGNANVAAVTITGGGSRWSSSGNLYVGKSSPGTLDISRGGQATVESNVQIWTHGAVSAGPEGAFRVGGTITNSGRIEIAADGLVSAESVSNDCIIQNDGTLSGDVLNLPGGNLRGSGRYNGMVTIGDGSSLQPGKIWGTMRGRDFVFGAGGKLWQEINRADGTPGTNWDLLSLSGTLTITATAENPFLVDLVSRDEQDAEGLLKNFDGSKPFSWHFLSADGGIVGFSSDKFKISAIRFRNLLERGAFSISQKGNGLYLDFTPAAQ